MESGIDIHHLEVGQSYRKSVVISQERVELFARASGDTNPLHLDDNFAKGTRFGRRVAHGMLAAGIIGGIFGTEFPGYGTIYLSQEIKFIRPVFVGDEITFVVEIIEKIIDKNRLILSTVGHNQHGEKVVEGKAVVLPPAHQESRG